MQNLAPRPRQERAESFLHPTRMTSSAILSPMDAVALTRQLVDIESITGNEARVGDFLYRELCEMGYETRKMQVEADRFNVYATRPQQASHSVVVFSTHMDTVPP